ncbi:hypothetical protein [Streptomyces sp. NRRL F-5135]|uniref:hypothetical protein n=1 Tax=Streptomyces sp. NRRL F-5135 TaxID=1463858 RepID=UPI0004C62409|nr:hypothetical protein [Streptomyces sp. NRRL F-5135]
MTNTTIPLRCGRIIRALADGQDYATIAAGLEPPVSPAAVRSYVSRAARAAGVHTRAGLVGHYVHRGILRLPPPAEPPPAAPPEHLYRTLLCLASGLRDDETAVALDIAPITAKSYSADVRAFYQAHHRAHAVALAYRHGHLQAPGSVR